LDAVDIRFPLTLEVEYEILEREKTWMLYFTLRNEEGEVIFCTIDTDESWRNQPRPAGSYVSRAMIPGNFLAEGTVFVTIAARTLNPTILRVNVMDEIAFQVIDRMEGGSARVDHAGDLGGIVRPYLAWKTEPAGPTSPPNAVGQGDYAPVTSPVRVPQREELLQKEQIRR
jgi:lipopolysaccharide transport system ATP-binding protein